MSKHQELIFSVGLNENSQTFLYTFEKGGQENVFSKVYVEMSTTKNMEYGF